MNLCGWTPSTKVITNPFTQKIQQSKPMPINLQANINKVSVKPSQFNNNGVNVYYGNKLPNCQVMNHTLPTNSMTKSNNWEYTPNKSICKKQSIIDRISQNKIRQDLRFNQSRMTPTKDNMLFRSAHEKQRLKSQQPLIKSSYYTYTEPALQKSYSDLLKENIELKRIVYQQYNPLKQMYIRLKQQHDDRQFLVSKLQWKVKELAKEIRNRKF